MKITRLTKRFGRTIGYADHQFIKLESELTAEFEPGDTFDSVDAELFELNKQAIQNDLRKFKEARKKK